MAQMELVGEAPERFGMAEEEKPSRHQSLGQTFDHPLHQIRD